MRHRQEYSWQDWLQSTIYSVKGGEALKKKALKGFQIISGHLQQLDAKNKYGLETFPKYNYSTSSQVKIDKNRWRIERKTVLNPDVPWG